MVIKIDAATRENIEKELNILKEMAAKEDSRASDLKEQTEKLSQVAMKLGEVMYQQQAQAGAANQGGDSANAAGADGQST